MDWGFWVVQRIWKKNVMLNAVRGRVPWIIVLSSEEQRDGLWGFSVMGRAIEYGLNRRSCDPVDPTEMVLCDGGVGYRRFVLRLEFWKWEERYRHVANSENAVGRARQYDLATDVMLPEDHGQFKDSCYKTEV